MGCCPAIIEEKFQGGTPAQAQGADPVGCDLVYRIDRVLIAATAQGLSALHDGAVSFLLDARQRPARCHQRGAGGMGAGIGRSQAGAHGQLADDEDVGPPCKALGTIKQLRDAIALTPRGEIEIDHRGHTSQSGIFAAGDATTVPFKQIVIAMGEGAKAGLSAFDYLIRMPAEETRDWEEAA
jgi:hypothetical protein